MPVPEPGENPPRIPPRLAEEARPLWSVMIPVCNRLNYLEQTLRSILAQDPGAETMQIEVIDNSTTNPDVETFVRDIAVGRVGYFRQPVPVGMGINWNTCIARSRGELVHIIHDDDYLAPGFYPAMADLAQRFPQVGLLISRCLIVDEAGVLNSVTERLKWLETGSTNAKPAFWPNLIFCPGVVVRRRVYEELGGFLQNWGASTDYEMWLRAMVAYGAASLAEPLAYYRQHSQSFTAENLLTGQFWRELWRAGLQVSTYAPNLDSDAMRLWLEKQLVSASETYDRAGNIPAALANFRVFREITTPRGVLWWLLHRAAKRRWRQLGREFGALAGVNRTHT